MSQQFHFWVYILKNKMTIYKKYLHPHVHWGAIQPKKKKKKTPLCHYNSVPSMESKELSEFWSIRIGLSLPWSGFDQGMKRVWKTDIGKRSILPQNSTFSRNPFNWCVSCGWVPLILLCVHLSVCLISFKLEKRQPWIRTGTALRRKWLVFAYINTKFIFKVSLHWFLWNLTFFIML